MVYYSYRRIKEIFYLELNGTYQATGKGFGFLIPEDGKGREDDWFVPPRSEGGAWNGDRVLAVPVEDDRGGQRRTAKITAVVCGRSLSG